LDIKLEPNQRYKICLLDRFLCLDIDRKPKDIAAESGDGLKNLYAWFKSIGKPIDLLPSYLCDIERFPAYTKTPSNGLHLFFLYHGKPITGLLCPHVEIKTVQLSAGYKDGKPYIFHGDISKTPNLPPFIQNKLPHTDYSQLLTFTSQQKQYGKHNWAKIKAWTDADGNGTEGRNSYAHSLGTVSKDRQKGKNRIKRRRGGGKKWEGINDYTQ
jgi:hypothetical protein